MESKKTLNSIKDISKEDWDKIADIIVNTQKMKYKKAFAYLTDKYDVNFTYQNFYIYLKKNGLKILKDAIFYKYFEDLKKEVEDIKNGLEKELEELILLKRCCRECVANYKDFAKILNNLVEKAELNDKQKSKLKEYAKKLIEIAEKNADLGKKNTIAYYVEIPKRAEKIKGIFFSIKNELNSLNQ